MKVLNLSCERGHGFEGWFASEQAFVSQQSEGLVTCPLCDSAKVVKLPSAPRLNLGAPRPEGQESAADAQRSASNSPSDGSAGLLPATAQGSDELYAAYCRGVRALLASTEDVGERFATEVRKIHAGDAAERQIRGQATPEEVRELAEDGIDVLPLVVPPHLKEPLQ